jgi:peptidoglycan/LPS O-acetylase OafA/YrhL
VLCISKSLPASSFLARILTGIHQDPYIMIVSEINYSTNRISILQNSSSRLDWLDALRGVAILLVIGVHTSQVVAVPAFLAPLFEQGARGVQLFFAISGFTMLLTLEKKHPSEFHKWASFAIRRIFRIAPLFWTAAFLWYFLTGGARHYWAPDGSSLFTLFLTVSFVSNWFISAHSAIVPGGWSIAAEMNMYCLLPWLEKRITNWRIGLLWLAGSMLVGAALSFIGYMLFIPHSQHPELVRAFFNSYWLPTGIPSFVAGIVAFRLWSNVKISLKVARILFLLSICAFCFIAYTPVFLKSIIYAPVFCVIVYSFGSLVGHKKLLPAITWLGKISYSAYFIHFLVLQLMRYSLPSFVTFLSNSLCGSIIAQLVVIASSIIISSLTFLLIEKPFVKMGESFSRQLQVTSAS